jgi:hypothetical protein
MLISSLRHYASVGDLVLPVLPTLTGVAIFPYMTGGGVIVSYMVALVVLWTDRRLRGITVAEKDADERSRRTKLK